MKTHTLVIIFDKHSADRQINYLEIIEDSETMSSEEIQLKREPQAARFDRVIETGEGSYTHWNAHKATELHGHHLMKSKTQIVYTEVIITPCPSGFGEYQCGELQIGPQTSFAMLQDLERAGELTPIDDALSDPEFQAAGIQDIRGRIRYQPGRIYAKLEQDAFGVRVVYFGVDESEVPLDFYEDHPTEPQASLTITYSTSSDWGADGAWWEGAVDLDAEARACGFTSTPAVETIQLSGIAQLDDGEFCRLASQWGIARSNGWTSADVDQVIVAEINRRDVGDEHLIGYRAARLASESTAK